MKKVMFFAGLVSFVALIIWAIVSEKESSSPSAPSVASQVDPTIQSVGDPKENAERAKIRDQWIKDAEKVAKDSGDEQALIIVKFLKDNGVLAKVHGNGVMVLEEAKSELWFTFTPVLEKDREIGGPWAVVVNRQEAGNFIPSSRSLVVRDFMPCTSTWRGICLLHEGNHAGAWIVEQYPVDDPKTFCEKERDTHEFQNRVTAKLGGKAYDELMEKLVSEIRTEIANVPGGGQIGVHISHRSHHYPELDTLFGKSLSDFERDFRETAVWVHGYFLLYDRTFSPEEVEDRKAIFLYNIYKERGMFPDSK